MTDPLHSDATALTPLEAAAAQAHEVYTSLRRAGFSELQALRIVGFLLRGGNR